MGKRSVMKEWFSGRKKEKGNIETARRQKRERERIKKRKE